jgi:hypothetical protein
VSYYDEDGPDYDSLSYHSMVGYCESLAEDGRTLCGSCDTVYDLAEDHSDPGCPDCMAVEAMQEAVANGEASADAICSTCHAAVSETRFMGCRVCWACYTAIANGDHKRDRGEFANPGGGSALRAAGPGNPRVHPCPRCRESNALTPQDVARGYVCDPCADQAEGRMVPGREY